MKMKCIRSRPPASSSAVVRRVMQANLPRDTRPEVTLRRSLHAAAKELDDLRNRWLNPPEWTKTEVLESPGSTDGPWARYIDPATVVSRVQGSGFRGHGSGDQGRSSFIPHPSSSSARAGRPHPNPLPEGEGTSASHARPSSLAPRPSGIGTVRWPRIVPKDPDCAESLTRRTLTNLYNERPAWLDLAHKRLDQSVFAAYGWDQAISDEQLLEKLLELNLARAPKKADETGGRR